jgi:integrase/recombinase XerD
VLEWVQQPLNARPAYWAARLSFVRGFARYRSAIDPRTQVPPTALLPFKPKRARPYLYSDEEIRSLLRAALRMPCRDERGKLRPWVYYCLFGLLSVSGLRLGEARNLELQDVDLKAAVLTIRGAKCGKTRLVPLHASTCKVLANYIARRRRHWAGRAVSSYLFVSNRVIVWMAGTFIELSTRSLGRLVCGKLPTVVALVCTTCVRMPRPGKCRMKSFEPLFLAGCLSWDRHY